MAWILNLFVWTPQNSPQTPKGYMYRTLVTPDPRYAYSIGYYKIRLVSFILTSGKSTILILL